MTKSKNPFPSLWDLYLSRRIEIKHRTMQPVEFGLCIMSNEEGVGCTALVGVAVTDSSGLPEGMVSQKVSAADYAVFTHSGPFFPEGLGETYRYIHGEWLPSSKYICSGNVELEWYDERFKGVAAAGTQIDIYVPVKVK